MPQSFNNATPEGNFGYHSLFVSALLVNEPLMKTLRQQNRPVISYVPRIEPAPPEHAVKMEGFQDVWILRGKYVAFVFTGETFARSQAFTIPESAQRWATQMRQEEDITE